MNIEQAEGQKLHRREQERNDEGPHPGIEEELCAEASQQVGNAPRQLNNLPHVSAVEEEKLVLFLIMQMVRIGQSEKEEDGHVEKKRI